MCIWLFCLRQMLAKAGHGSRSRKGSGGASHEPDQASSGNRFFADFFGGVPFDAPCVSQHVAFYVEIHFPRSSGYRTCATMRVGVVALLHAPECHTFFFQRVCSILKHFFCSCCWGPLSFRSSTYRRTCDLRSTKYLIGGEVTAANNHTAM